MKTAAQIVHEFVLDKVEGEPLSAQIELYGALADLAPTPAESRSYRAIRKELKDVVRHHRQLVLNFKRATEVDGGDGQQA